MPQGASGNTPKAGAGGFVKFTRQSAQRIAKVVADVEGGDRDQGPIVFGMRATPANAKVFRVCTFTGSWSIGEDKTVTFKNQATPPNTAVARNLFFPVTNTASSSRDCAIAKEGTAWFLIDVRMQTATAVFVTGTQTSIFVSSTANSAVLTDVTLSASLNTSACTISIGKTLVTASRIFVTGTATGIFATSTVAATYLQME